MSFAPTAIRAMRQSLRTQAPALKPVFQPHVGRFTVGGVIKCVKRARGERWAPALALWGGAGAGAVTLFLSGVPLFQGDVLKKIPFVAGFFEDTTPDSDKPF